MIRKVFSALCALAVLLCMLTACTTQPSPTDAPTDLPTEGPIEPPTQGDPTDSPTGDPDPTDDPVMPEVYFVGDTEADFTVTLSDGSQMTLSKLLETKELVILNFWATWCGPCQMEFPYMEEAYVKHQDKVEIIALSVEPTDTNDVIDQFKTANGLTALPMGQDSTGLSAHFYFDGIPTSVAIDRFGVVCWQESGSITSTDKFERLFSGFLGEDYTESKVGYVIPGPAPTVANAEDSALTAALNAEGSAFPVTNSTDPGVWPFLPTGDGKLKSTNAGVDETSSVVNAAVTAKAGDVLTFDYQMSSEAGMDWLQLEVDGSMVDIFSGEEAGAYAYAFTADGNHTVTFSYVKDMAESAGGDYAIIDNLQVLTGDAAAAALAALPTYPLTLEGSDCQIVPVGGKEVVITDPNGMYEALIGISAFMMDAEEATFTIQLGKDLNPKLALVCEDFTGSSHPVNTLPQTEDGFTVTLPVGSIEAGSYSNTFVLLYPNYMENPDDFVILYVFRNEENVNAFVVQDLPAYGVTGASWTYADGSAPSTDEIAQPGLGTETGTAQYTVYLIDQNSEPVANAMVQVCDADTCQVIPTDEYGMVTFMGAPYAYEIHVLQSPDGYTFDTEAVYTMPEAGGELEIKGTKN